jgi:hypothetical protein
MCSKAKLIGAVAVCSAALIASAVKLIAQDPHSKLRPFDAMGTAVLSTPPPACAGAPYHVAGSLEGDAIGSGEYMVCFPFLDSQNPASATLLFMTSDRTSTIRFNPTVVSLGGNSTLFGSYSFDSAQVTGPLASHLVSGSGTVVFHLTDARTGTIVLSGVSVMR